MQDIAAPTVVLTYLGGPTLLIEIGQLRLLSDPTFDGAGCEYFHGPIRLEKLDNAPKSSSGIGPIDAVLLSHDQHADNLDTSGRAFLPKAGQVLTTPESAARIGDNAIALETWQSVSLNDAQGKTVQVTAVPAQHGPDGTQEMTGTVTGFLLEWPGQVYGPLYLSGDTVLFEGIDEIAQRYRIGTAVLHLGRVRLLGNDAIPFSLDATDGARLAALIGAQQIVPVHYEGWAHFTQPRLEAEQAFAQLGIAEQVMWLPLGESVEVPV